MWNKKKNILSLFLAVIVILSLVPAVYAESADAVNLITDENFYLRDGVYLYSNGKTFGDEAYAAYYLGNAFDGKESTAWLSTKTSKVPYLQINFPVAQQLTQIKVKPTKVSNYDIHKDFEIRVSNDYDFGSYTEIGMP